AYYEFVLGRPVDGAEFVRLDAAFHDAYRSGLLTCRLTVDARTAIAAWAGTQSLLSMWFHDELVPTVDSHGLTALLARVDGLRATIGGGFKAPHLEAHLREL